MAGTDDARQSPRLVTVLRRQFSLTVLLQQHNIHSSWFTWLTSQGLIMFPNRHPCGMVFGAVQRKHGPDLTMSKITAGGVVVSLHGWPFVWLDWQADLTL